MKTITIHTTPIFIGLIIAFSLLLAFTFAHTLIGLVSLEDKQSKKFYYDDTDGIQGSEKVWYTERKTCTWNLINWEQECYQSRVGLATTNWLGGLILSSIFSTIWFGFLFYWANSHKRWVKVRWVE